MDSLGINVNVTITYLGRAHFNSITPFNMAKVTCKGLSDLYPFLLGIPDFHDCFFRLPASKTNRVSMGDRGRMVMTGLSGLYFDGVECRAMNKMFASSTKTTSNIVDND